MPPPTKPGTSAWSMTSVWPSVPRTEVEAFATPHCAEQSLHCRNKDLLLQHRHRTHNLVNECYRLVSSTISKQLAELSCYCSFAYSALAAFRMGVLASSQRARKP